MTMLDWVTKLDEFLKVSDRELLDQAGRVSAEAAKAKAELEYERYHVLHDQKPREIGAELEKFTKQLKKLPPRRGKKRGT